MQTISTVMLEFTVTTWVGLYRRICNMQYMELV